MNKFSSVFCFLVLSLSLSGCLGETNDHLKSMDKSTDKMATELEKDREYVKNLSDQSQKVADQLEALQVTSAKLFASFMGSFASDSVTPRTSDINDVIPTSHFGPNNDIFKKPYIENEKTVKISEQKKCVGKSIQSVLDSIIQYDAYVDRDKNIFPIKMIKSQSYISKSQTETDAIIWVVMQPLMLGQAEYYPRFSLRCATQLLDKDHFVQKCRIASDPIDLKNNNVKERKQFSLLDMESTVRGTWNGQGCGVSNTELEYQVRLNSIPQDVEMIKTALVGENNGLRMIVDSLFKEEVFFKNYFKGFYERWLASLK